MSFPEEKSYERGEPSKVLFETYFPGAIGLITRLHADYYHRHWGFDKSFEIQVARELSDFVESLDPTRDDIWIALVNGVFAGSIAIDGSRWSEEGARLRWFIVDPMFQAHGIGSALMRKALAFSRERRFARVFLWTFRGLEAARRIYERQGFVLSVEHEVAQWGGTITEQRFDLVLEE